MRMVAALCRGGHDAFACRNGYLSVNMRAS